MKEFGYTFDDIEGMTRDQVRFLMTGLQLEAREQRSAKRRAKLKGH